MAVRLVRESSETPNITNRDDTKMIRYAYGGHNGIVKDYGSELSGTNALSEFRLGSGRVVLDGWEVDIDEQGYTYALSSLYSTMYHTLYLEINVSLETAELKVMYSSANYPIIAHGDDLTKEPFGTARLALWNFKSVNGRITEISRACPILQYANQELDKFKDGLESGSIIPKFARYASEDTAKGTIEERLTRLGFKSGTISFMGGSYGPSSVPLYSGIYRQGNYVIGTLIDDVHITSKLFQDYLSVGKVIFTVPPEFAPQERSIAVFSIESVENTARKMYVRVNIESSGQAVVSDIGSTGSIFFEDYTVYMKFGYEAVPL